MKFKPFSQFEKPLVPLVPINIELYDTATGRTLTLDWFGEIDTGSTETFIAAEVLPDLSAFENLPKAGVIRSYSSWHQREFRRMKCRLLFGGVPFAERAAFIAPDLDADGVWWPHWPAMLGTQDFLSTFTVTWEYHKTPPVFHVKNPRGRLGPVPDVDQLFNQVNGTLPQWRLGRAPETQPPQRSTVTL